MTEREGRPQEQQDAGREQARRVSFEATAVRLGIPPELWEQPTVKQFISIVNHVDTLHIDLATVIPHSTDQDANGTPSLAARYQAVEQLLGVTSALLTDGFN